jgi:hypothetical protein
MAAFMPILGHPEMSVQMIALTPRTKRHLGNV